MPLVILDPLLSTTVKVAAFVGPTLVHVVVGNVIEPLVFGSSMELHPVTVLLALALWYSLWGISGAILAVPITAVLRIVMDAMNHPYARVVVAVLEGRISSAVEETSAALDLTHDDGAGGDDDGGGGGASPTRAAAHSIDTDAGGADADAGGGGAGTGLGSGGGGGGEARGGRLGGGIAMGVSAGARLGALLRTRVPSDESREGLLGGDDAPAGRDVEGGWLLGGKGGAVSRAAGGEARGGGGGGGGGAAGARPPLTPAI